MIGYPLDLLYVCLEWVPSSTIECTWVTRRNNFCL